MANEKVIYSVKRSYYRNCNFVCNLPPVFYDSDFKAIDSVRTISCIYGGIFYGDDNYHFVSCTFKEGDLDCIVSIDSHLLF